MRINCHCHIFSLHYVPGDFRRRFLLERQSHGHAALDWLANRLLPPDGRLKTWWEFSEMSIGQIARRLVAEMDEAGIDLCTPLMMDMAFCEGYSGEVGDFEDQIAETVEAVSDVEKRSGRPRMLPFIAADPRRENVVEVVTDALSGPHFHGVKIYPVMGFTPDDRRLYPIYEFCGHRDIPITTHCQWGGIPGLHEWYRLAAPKYWWPVLEQFPGLTLNLAHNGHEGSPWQRHIRDLILRHPNVYTDLSYALEMRVMPWHYFRHVKEMLHTPHLRDRVLYGTDWYMGRVFWTEKSYLEWFTRRAARIPFCWVRFTDGEMRRLTERNPKEFLGLT